jgi:hypothetical protein
MSTIKVALVCIAKNEDPYIQEWVEYNTKLGFDHIHLFQNDWRTDYEHPNLIKYVIDGLNKQRSAYNLFLHQYGNRYDWAAFFDVDEFLVLKKHKTIKEFVLDYNDKAGVGINWVMFGNNGHTEVIDNEYSQIKRFTKREKGINNHIKTILNLKYNFLMDIHNPVNLMVSDTNGNLINGPFNDKGTDEVAQINHYYCKTPDEFIKKCERGRADTAYYRNVYPDNYNPSNLNDVEDLWAYNFMYGN